PADRALLYPLQGSGEGKVGPRRPVGRRRGGQADHRRSDRAGEGLTAPSPREGGTSGRLVARQERAPLNPTARPELVEGPFFFCGAALKERAVLRQAQHERVG